MASLCYVLGVITPSGDFKEIYRSTHYRNIVFVRKRITKPDLRFEVRKTVVINNKED